MRGSYGMAEMGRAERLFEAGIGFKGASARLGIPTSTVREWHAAWRAFGDGWLSEADVQRDYPADLKLDCARSCVEGGASVVEAMRRFGVGNRRTVKQWNAAYRARGAEAFNRKEAVA